MSENDRGSAVALSCFNGASQKRQQRRRDFPVHRHNNDVAFVNRFARWSRRSNAEATSDANADREHLHLFS